MPKQNIIWILIILGMGAVLLGVWKLGDKDVGDGPGQLQGVQATYELINDEYYKPLDSQELKRAAVCGMVDFLDGFSTYFPPESAGLLNQRIRGVTASLGLELKFEPTQPVTAEGVMVLGALLNSPGHKAGIYPGTRIYEINDKPLRGLTEGQVRNLLTGQIGETVKLNIINPAGIKSVITLRRKPFEIETVEGFYRNSNARWVYKIPGSCQLLYIRIGEFTPKTKQMLQTTLREISANSARGLVIDLRDNPGGLLPDGVAVGDMFLSRGHIVTVVSRKGKETHNAHTGTPYAKIPIVVLINDGSASAAEIVSGALRENNRGLLVGTNTRGKGCVQTMISLPDSLGQVNLTTAEFFVNPQHPVQRKPGSTTWGVTPDIRVAMTPLQTKRLVELQTQGKVIPLVPGVQQNVKYLPPAPEVLASDLLEADPQLQEAVKLLSDPKLFQKILEKNRSKKKSKPNAH